MDNYATAYKALKLFRDAMVAFIKKQLESAYGNEWWERGVRRVFSDEHFDGLEKMFQRRFSGISVVTRPGTEQYEILDINYFTNIIEANREQAFDKPFGGDLHRVLVWLKEIVDLRNPVAHPETGDLSSDDVWRCLDNIERMLRIIDPNAVRGIRQLKSEFKAKVRTTEVPIKSLEGILRRDAPGLFGKICNIGERIQEQYIPRFPSLYVGEPKEHYRTVTKRLGELLPLPIMREMSCEEIFVLLSAVQVHEIGMATDREDPETIRELLDSFHSHTRWMILQEYEALELSRSEASAIGYLCYGHRGEGILDVPDEVLIGSPPQPVRLLFLTALFRLAHALDQNQVLAVLFRNEGREYREEKVRLQISVNPDIWEIGIRSMPYGPKEESLVRCAFENAQKEVGRCKRFLGNYGLNFHTIGLQVDSSLYERLAPKATVSVNPYKGLDVFSEEDADLFFGRKKDIDALLGKVCSYDLVTLRGASGVGKTSLLRAGLTPQLEKLGYQVIYARGYEDPEKGIKEAVCRSIPEARALGEKSFSDFVLAVSDLSPRTVILFDQAEEIFTRVSNEIRREFVEKLATLTSDRKFDIKLVFSLREDYFSPFFDILSRDVPSLCLPERTYRLANLDEKGIREAVAAPLHGTVTIEDAVLDRIADDLQEKGLYYPPDVQIVGHRLFEERDKERNEISLRAYETLGGTEGIISDYFLGLVEGYPPDRKKLARNILKLLVTSYETKAQFTLEEIRRSLNLPTGDESDLSKMLDQLVSDRLVNRIPEQKYELIHDYLAVQIKERWITGEELEVKRLREMLRWRVREWQEFGAGVAHLLPSDGLHRLFEHAYELHLSRIELEFIITSAIRHGTEIAPWLEQLEPETAVEMLAPLTEIERASIKAHAIEAMGMTRSVKAIRYLVQALEDESEDVRRAAMEALGSAPIEAARGPFAEKASIHLRYALRGARNWVSAAPIIEALKEIDTVTAIEALQEAAFKHGNVYIREGAKRALAQVEKGKLVPVLIQLLDSGDEDVRSNALLSLEQVYSDEVFDQLVEALSDEDDGLRKGAIDALEYLDLERSVVPLIYIALGDKERESRQAAAMALERFESRKAISILEEAIGTEEAAGALAQGLGSDNVIVRRWAARGLGEVGDEQAVDPLIIALEDKDPLVRQEVARALGKLGDKRAVKPLINTLQDENPRVLHHAVDALRKLGDERAIGPLIAVLETEDSIVRWSAAKALGQIGDERAVDSLTVVLKDQDPDTRRKAIEALGMIWEITHLAALADEDSSVRRRAAEALGEWGDGRVVEPLISILGDESSEVRHCVAEALGELGDKRAVEPLMNALRDVDSVVRQRATEALEELGDKRAVEPLINALGDVDSVVRQRATEALRKLGDKRAIEPLINALRDVDSVVRRRAVEALEQIGGERAVESLTIAVREGEPDIRRKAIEALGMIWEITHLVALADEDSSVRRQAAEALGNLGDERAIKPLIATLKDEDPIVRRSAAEALGQLGDEQAVEALVDAMCEREAEARHAIRNALVCIGLAAQPMLISALKAQDSFLRYGAADVLGRVRAIDAIEDLISLLNDPEIVVRLKVTEALGKLGDERAVEPLIAALEHEDPAVCRKAAEALGRLSDERAIEPLINALGDEDSVVRHRAAWALGELGDERAVEPLIAALQDEDPVTRQKAAKALGELGDERVAFFRWEELAEIFKKVVPNEEAARFCSQLARWYRHNGQLENAMQACQKAIELEPENSYHYNGLGTTYRLMGQYEKAIHSYQKAVELEPESSYPYNGLGMTYQLMGQHEKAIHSYQKAVDLEPESSYPYNGLGMTYRLMGQYEKAINSYQKAVELDPGNPYHYNGLGATYRLMGQYEEASNLYQQALQCCKQRTSEEALTYAWLLVLTGEVKDGLDKMRRIIEAQPLASGLLHILLTDAELLAATLKPPEGIETVQALLREANREAAKKLARKAVNPYEIPIEDLQLSTRVCNCLKRAGITKVGEILERLEEGNEELLKIHDFGVKSLTEVKEKLRAIGLIADRRSKAE